MGAEDGSTKYISSRCAGSGPARTADEGALDSVVLHSFTGGGEAG